MPETVIWQTLVDFKGHWAYLTTQNYVRFSNWLTKSGMDLSLLSHLKSIMVGGAPVPEKYEDVYLKTLPNLKMIINAYGQTELCVISLSSTPKMLGYVLPGVIARVSDVETGQPLGPNKRGEIQIKSPLMLKCYLKQEEATAELLTKDQFVKTGDLGFYDQEGNLYFVERLKSLIK